jgi:phosphoglycerate dehydrogenase-like enzyme
LIGAAALRALPDDAIVVNIGRGPIIDEGALFAEVQSGRLRAGLDVWWQYPTDEASRAATPPSAFDFGALDNVVMTPHYGGWERDSERHRLSALAELLNAAARGEPLPNRVDLGLGY